MILADMGLSPVSWLGPACGPGGGLSKGVSLDVGTLLPSAQVILMICSISSAYAKCGPTERPEGGRIPRILLGRGRGAVLHPVADPPADRHARGRDGDGVAGAPSAGGQPDRGR